MKTYIKRNALKILGILPLLGVSVSARAAEGSMDFYPDILQILIAVGAFIAVFVALIMIYYVINLMVKMRELEIYERHGLEEFLAERRANQGSWWNRFSRRMTGAVPLDREDDIMFDHEYDGIRELDNNLPPWWLYGFYLSIAIAIFYIGFYHFSPYAKSSQEIYALEMEQAAADVEEYLSKQADQVDENTITLLTDEVSLAEGQEIFNVNCAVCHLQHGGSMPGGVGPNLTDEYWLHGGGLSDVFKTIKYGVPEKGMISWKSQLRPADMHKVSSFIMTLQGTNPENAKEPQGELYVAQAEPMTTDSTTVSEN